MQRVHQVQPRGNSSLSFLEYYKRVPNVRMDVKILYHNFLNINEWKIGQGFNKSNRNHTKIALVRIFSLLWIAGKYFVQRVVSANLWWCPRR